MLALGALAAQPPHLVYVLIDDLGFNDFIDSSDLSQAWPNAAALAAEQCVSVDWFYTQPLCTPTRGALLTGRYPTRLGLQHGVIQTGQNYGLPLTEVTLAEALQQRGYRTVGIGKWHLGQYTNSSLPTRRGFDHWYGYLAGSEDHYNHTATDHTGHDFLDLWDDEVADRRQRGVYEAGLFAARAATRIAEQPRGVPLFLYYAMCAAARPGALAPDR